MSERELPSGWVETTLAHIAEINMGQSPEGMYTNTEDVGFPLLGGASDMGEEYPCPSRFTSKPTKISQPGDLIFCVRATIGKVNVGIGQYCLGRGVASFRSKFNSPAWLRFFLKAKTPAIEEMGTGSTFKQVDKKKLDSVPVLLPPLNEQHRIADRIDALQARSRRAREALAEAQNLLEQFRQSVLSAAFRGDLSAKWREEHADAEPASELLKRIRTERRKRWEEAEQAKYAAKGKTPPPGWQKKYPEPVQVDTADLPELPDGWCWASLDEILLDIEAGKNFKCVETPPLEGEWGIVKVSAVTWGIFQENESKTITNDELVNYSLQIKEGDFLFSRANTIELVGASVVVNKILKNLILSDKILRFVFAFDLRHWVNFFLKSKEGRRQIEGRSSGNQASMRNISQENIARLPIPLASEHEMLYLVEKVAAALKKYEMTSAAIESQANSISVLDQSILAKAFRGELVPQDPDDEPAAKLLEQIQSEKARELNTAKRQRR